MPGRWRITAGPYELDADQGTAEWVWVVSRRGATTGLTVVADRAAMRARRTGLGPRAVREAVATRGFSVVVDAIRTAGEPPRRIVIGAPVPAARADEPAGGGTVGTPAPRGPAPG